MIEFIILILCFGAVALLVSPLLPKIFAKFERAQKKKFDKTLEHLEEKMFLEIKGVKKEKLYFFFVLSPIVFGALGFILFNHLFAILIGAAIGSALPGLITKQLEKRRKKQFHGQLVDALLLISNSLRSGLSFLQAIEVVVEEMPAPISQEFNLLINENKMGVAFEESLQRLNKRMYSEELNMMITSILVARETGGDLGKVFQRLVVTIRTKMKIARQVETLTMQGRLQGIIMMVLPFIFAFMISRMNPGFFDIMLKSDVGRFLLMYAVFSQVIGMLLINHLSRVEV